jgi:hypothetical protein
MIAVIGVCLAFALLLSIIYVTRSGRKTCR